MKIVPRFQCVYWMKYFLLHKYESSPRGVGVSSPVITMHNYNAISMWKRVNIYLTVLLAVL